MSEKVYMKGYKAFKPGLICDPTGDKPFQFAENAVFEESEANICHSGFHFCKNPLAVLDYYPLIDDDGNMTEFAEVEALDEVQTDDNEKYCTKKIRIGGKISFSTFIKESFSVMYENIKKEIEEETKDLEAGGYNATLAGGDWAKLAGGNWAKLAGGNWAKLAGGNNAKLAGGDWAKLAGGYNATLAGGDNATLAGGNNATLAGGNWAKLAGGYNATLAGGYNATLAGGDWAKLAGGDWAKLAGGDWAKLAGGNNAKLAGGNNAKLAGGKCSVVVGEKGSIAKGGKGSVILLIERSYDGEIISYKAEMVDDKKIKADTWYKLVDGEFTEVLQNENI